MLLFETLEIHKKLSSYLILTGEPVRWQKGESDTSQGTAFCIVLTLKRECVLYLKQISRNQRNHSHQIELKYCKYELCF